MSRNQVDAKLWRSVERFVIIQPDGKQRVIDIARRASHNLHTQTLETIHTQYSQR